MQQRDTTDQVLLGISPMNTEMAKKKVDAQNQPSGPQSFPKQVDPKSSLLSVETVFDDAEKDENEKGTAQREVPIPVLSQVKETHPTGPDEKTTSPPSEDPKPFPMSGLFEHAFDLLLSSLTPKGKDLTAASESKSKIAGLATAVGRFVKDWKSQSEKKQTLVDQAPNSGIGAAIQHLITELKSQPENKQKPTDCQEQVPTFSDRLAEGRNQPPTPAPGLQFSAPPLRATETKPQSPVTTAAPTVVSSRLREPMFNPHVNAMIDLAFTALTSSYSKFDKTRAILPRVLAGEVPETDLIVALADVFSSLVQETKKKNENAENQQQRRRERQQKYQRRHWQPANGVPCQGQLQQMQAEIAELREQLADLQNAHAVVWKSHVNLLNVMAKDRETSETDRHALWEEIEKLYLYLDKHEADIQTAGQLELKVRPENILAYFRR